MVADIFMIFIFEYIHVTAQNLILKHQGTVNQLFFESHFYFHDFREAKKLRN